jgi:conjugative relaxase-like TrwC/TraI family protein
VLTVAKVTANGAGGYAEYLDGRAEPTVLGDYYLKDGERVEVPGRWAGGAGWLGCDAELPVTGEVLRELMAVRHPQTGQALRPVGGNGQAVAAIDATFSAPKSVSAAWALADGGLRERIEAAHEQAIDRALGYATRTVAMVRERVDRQTVQRVTPAGLIATSWRHTTARAVADRPPDPQLHSHVLLHGALRRDGRVVAIDSRAWLAHRRELGAAYRTELAQELHRLGFQVQRATGRGGRYFKIEGIPAKLIDRWSSRHHQVNRRSTLACRRSAQRSSRPSTPAVRARVRRPRGLSGCRQGRACRRRRIAS